MGPGPVRSARTGPEGEEGRRAAATAEVRGGVAPGDARRRPRGRRRQPHAAGAVAADVTTAGTREGRSLAAFPEPRLPAPHHLPHLRHIRCLKLVTAEN